MIYFSILNDEFLHHLSEGQRLVTYVCISGPQPVPNMPTRSHYEIWYHVVVPRPQFVRTRYTTFWMYHRVHIKHVPIESMTWYQTGTVGTRPKIHCRTVLPVLMMIKLWFGWPV